MNVSTYVGARYVPKFSDVNGGEWSNIYSYEPLTIVKNGLDYYTSKIPVPAGVDISDTTYWAKTGDYNGAISSLDDRLSDIENIVNNENIINAIEIGADPTGAVDCSTIINDALSDSDNDNKVLYFPKGVYKVSSPINLDRNCLALGTLYTDQSNVIVKIVNQRLSFYFDKIGFATDGNVNSLSFANADNISIELNADITPIAQVLIAGNYLNGYDAIKFDPEDNFIQNVVIDIHTIAAKHHCYDCVSPSASHWTSEIITQNTVFNCTGIDDPDFEDSAIHLRGVSNNMNGWRFNCCSFEVDSGRTFYLDNTKVDVVNSRWSKYEQGGDSNDNYFNLSNAAALRMYGTYEIPTNRIAIADLDSYIQWHGALDLAGGFYVACTTMRMDNDEVITWGDKDKSRCMAAVFDYSADDEVQYASYWKDWEKGMDIKVHTHTNVVLNIPYANQYRRLTHNGNRVYDLFCIVNVTGDHSVTVVNTNLIGGSNSFLLNPAVSNVWLITMDGVYPLAIAT